MTVHKRFTTPSKHRQIFPGISNIVTVRKKSNWSLTVRSKLEPCRLLWNIWSWMLCVRANLVHHDSHYLISLLQEQANRKSFVVTFFPHSPFSQKLQNFLISSAQSMI